MPLSRRAKRTLSRLLAPAEQRARVERAAYPDAGHGYDALGLEPASFELAMAAAWPLYRYYFRVQSHDAVNVPSTGAVIVAANHSGMLPIDAALLSVDLFHRTRPPRIPRVIGDLFIPFMPWFGTAMTRAGMVSGARANVRYLLEQGELVVVFPEGTPGIGKGFSRRYQLSDWRVGHVELALAHGAPIVPVGIVGAEECWPQIARIDSSHGFGAPFLPIPATPLPLPVKVHVYYGEPLRLGRGGADDPETVRAGAERVKSAVARLLERGLRERRGWFS